MADTIEKLDDNSFKRIRTVEEVLDIKALKKERDRLLQTKSILQARIVSLQTDIDALAAQIAEAKLLGVLENG